MKRIIDTNESLGTLETPQGTCELCATANAGYDESSGTLMIELDAHLRTSDWHAKQQRVTADWLPPKEKLREHVSLEEAADVARDIFHRWVRKVKEAAPTLAQH